MKFYYFSHQADDNKKGSDKEFIGTVRIEKLENAPEPPHLRAVFVMFEPGSYTKLHHHTGDQLLYVTEGKGFIEFANGEEVLLKPGARVIIPAGTLHRHGANPATRLVHLAVTLGETFWWTADDGKIDTFRTI